MHLPSLTLTALLLGAGLFVAAEPVPDTPIRIQAMRGRAPSRQMADSIADQIKYAHQKVVYPEVVGDDHPTVKKAKNNAKGTVVGGVTNKEQQNAKGEWQGGEKAWKGYGAETVAKGKQEMKEKGKEGKEEGVVKVGDLDPNDIDSYPECSKICTAPALEVSGCKFPEDAYCMCHCPLFGDSAAACEAEKCSEEDIDLIHELGGKMCEPVGSFRPKIPASCFPHGKPAAKELLQELKE